MEMENVVKMVVVCRIVYRYAKITYNYVYLFIPYSLMQYLFKFNNFHSHFHTTHRRQFLELIKNSCALNHGCLTASKEILPNIFL